MREQNGNTTRWKVKTASAATLKDVAALAGVDKSSASVVLNGAKSSAGVSEAKRQRILAAAAELNYSPNGLARSLTRRRTDIISFYSGQGFLDPTDQLINAIITGLHLGCENHRKDLLLYGEFRGSMSDEIYRKLVDGKTDGLVFHTPPDNPLLEMIANSHLPAVAVVDAVPQLPSVTVDITNGMQRLAEYLHRKGHRRVLYRACPYREHLLSSVKRREDAFLEAARALEMQVVAIVAKDDVIAFNDDEMRLLKSRLSPTVSVSWSDNNARATMTHCARAGIRIPDDLAIAGSDGLRSETDDRMRITSVRAPWAASAALAVDLLIRLIEGKEVPSQTVLPVSLVAGDSA
jgi:LacI family transcriptional regulator